MSQWYRKIKTAQIFDPTAFEEKFSQSDITPEMLNEFRFVTSTEGIDTARLLMYKDYTVGEVTVMKDNMFEQSTKRLFKGIVQPDDKVLRMRGIYLAKPLRDMGLGKKMFLDAFAQFSDSWLGNSELGFGGTDPAAIYALESLKPRVSVHWYGAKGGLWVAKLDAEKGDLTPNKYFGTGFFTNMGYFKGGGWSAKAYDPVSAIDAFIQEHNFVPIYIGTGDSDPVLDLDDATKRTVFDKGYELVETRDSSKKQQLLQEIRDILISNVK